uniref:hypothetical protein n=1 Tax=Mariniphaga sediminis TaxID=1628158 RepID=UPI003567A1B2
MNRLFTGFIFVFFLWAFSAGTVSAQARETEIPKLQNPFSTDFLKGKLEKTKPRMIYNKQIVQQLRDKIKTDPVVKNL